VGSSLGGIGLGRDGLRPATAPRSRRSGHLASAVVAEIRRLRATTRIGKGYAESRAFSLFYFLTTIVTYENGLSSHRFLQKCRNAQSKALAILGIDSRASNRLLVSDRRARENAGSLGILNEGIFAQPSLCAEVRDDADSHPRQIV
jgi:hypothetical protein